MPYIVDGDIALSQPPRGPLAAEIARFAEWARAQGYARPSRHRQVLLAACFCRWLGHQGIRRRRITAEHADELSIELFTAVKSNDAKIGKFDRYGQRYTVDFLLEWRGKSAIIRSGWIIAHGSDVPRLTTAFPR